MYGRLQFTILASATIALAAANAPAARVVAQLQPADLPSASVPAAAPVPQNLADAVCPVVYQVDDSPGTHGYHYIFYGNSFFINREGYLLTAAHVISDFHNGGHPSILLRQPSAPPRLVKVEVVATDSEHDVAILRAIPNPFAGPYAVAALPLARKEPPIGTAVQTTALRPGHARNPATFELPIPDSYSATILDYRSMVLDQDSTAASASLASRRAPNPTKLFLFSHEVVRGQSGAPILTSATHEVLGLIEGRWLHPAAGSRATAGLGNGAAPSLKQGAAVPISYALALLQAQHISWSVQRQ